MEEELQQLTLYIQRYVSLGLSPEVAAEKYLARIKEEHRHEEEMKRIEVSVSAAAKDNRMVKIITSLEKNKIRVNDQSVVAVLGRIGQVDRYLEVGSANTEMALRVYESVKNDVQTATISLIEAQYGISLNREAIAPFVFGAQDENNIPKLVKILRISEGALDLRIRKQDVRYEAESVKFKHHAIVPMDRKTLVVDQELALKAGCRVGINEILVMPWYISTLHQQPSHQLKWIANQGRRLLEALEYLHSYNDVLWDGEPCAGYAHMDIKAVNVFVDSTSKWYLGDFGSCKPIGKSMTSCTMTFCWKDVMNQPAHPKYDMFMFTVMLVVECMKDRRDYKYLYEEPNYHVSMTKVEGAVKTIIGDVTAPAEVKELLNTVWNKFQMLNV